MPTDSSDGVKPLGKEAREELAILLLDTADAITRAHREVNELEHHDPQLYDAEAEACGFVEDNSLDLMRALLRIAIRLNSKTFEDRYGTLNPPAPPPAR